MKRFLSTFLLSFLVLVLNAQVLVNPYVVNSGIPPAMPTYVGKGTFANGTGNVTPTLPGSLVENDYMVLQVETSNQTVTAPAGWTQYSFSPETNPSSATRLTLFYKRYVPGDSNPVVTDPGDHAIAQVYAFRGVTTSGDGTSTSQNSGFSATTNFSIPCGTTSQTNQFIALFIADGADVGTNRFAGIGTNASLTSLTARESQSTTDGDGGGINMYTGQKAVAGSCGNLTGTLPSGTAFACISISLTAIPVIYTPVNTDLPDISGTPSIGETLTCSQGTWSSIGSTTYAYQWEKDGVDIGGSTSTTYVVQAGDDGHSIGCDVIATNSEGSSPEAAAVPVYITTLTTSQITSNHVYSGSDRLLLYLPPGYYSNSDDYPVVFFGHGNGERGVPIDSYTAIGTGNGSTTVFSGNLSNTNRLIHSEVYVTVSGLIVATGHFGTFTGTGVTGTYDYDDATSSAYSVTFTTAPASSAPIRIYFTQSNLLSQGPFRYLNLRDEPNCIFVAPQISRGAGNFADTEWTTVIDYLLAQGYRLDLNRIYSTGLSLGGGLAELALYLDWTYHPAAWFTAAPGSNDNIPAGGDSFWTRSENKGLYTVRGTSDPNGPGKIPGIMANGNVRTDREFPIFGYSYWGIGHSSALWDTKVYNRKNETHTGSSTADFDYLEDLLFKYSLDLEQQATQFVDYAILTEKSEDYRIAKRQVDNLTAGAVKTAQLARLATLKPDIGRVAIIDLGTSFRATSGTNINNLTSAATSATIANLVDDVSSSTGWTYTTTAAFDASPSTIDDIGSGRVQGRQFGFELNTTRDGHRVDAAGTVGTGTFSNLNNSETYTVKIYVAASNTAFTNRAEAQVVIGGVTKYLYCDTQNMMYIQYTGLSPSSGNISFNLSSRLTANTERLFYLQALEIIEEP